MKKMTLKTTVVAAILGLTFIAAAPSTSHACLFFCGEGGDEASVEVGIGAEVEDSIVSSGNGNTQASQNTNSVIVGDSAVALQSNSMGGIGINSGDVSQSNSANLSGQTNTTITGNDMRSFRGLNGNN